MDYKKIIKNRKTRFYILKVLSFVPDSIMLKIQYRIKLGRKLNLKSPQRFTEKLQWYKMHYRNPIMHQCVDKYAVRKFVKGRGLENTLVDLYGHYKSIRDVDFESLPNSFVIKTTHGGGGLNVVVCTDKSNLNLDEVREKLDFKEKRVEYNGGGREWAYYGLKTGIVVEELLVNKDNPEAGVNDYKIFCYNGKPKFIVVDVDRYIGHKRNFYDADWNNLYVTSDCPASDREIEKPKNYDEMLKIAATLSKGFPYVRVDLYNIEGKIYFGEMTFYPWSGYVRYDPDEFDKDAGNHFKLIKWGGDPLNKNK